MTGDEDLKSTATRNLFERLRQDILTGQLPYGTQLRQPRWLPASACPLLPFARRSVN